MVGTVGSVGIILWGLFMAGGGAWAVYAGRRAREAEAETGEAGEKRAGEEGADDAGTDDAGGSHLGGYIAAGFIILFGLLVVLMGVYTLVT